MGAGVTPSNGIRVTSSHTVLSLTHGVYMADPTWRVVALRPGPEVAVLKGSEDRSCVLRHTLGTYPVGRGLREATLREGARGSRIKQRLWTKGMDGGQIDGDRSRGNKDSHSWGNRDRAARVRGKSEEQWGKGTAGSWHAAARWVGAQGWVQSHKLSLSGWPQYQLPQRSSCSEHPTPIPALG